MRNAKTIVRVMNFHSLIRVDAARKNAEKYLLLEKEASDIIEMIVNNRNFILDKKMWEIDREKPPLNIYFGSDYGFCGSINFQVNQTLDKDERADKILIGKKIRTSRSGVMLKISREDFITKYQEIEQILSDSIQKGKHSEINLIYNHFYNTSNIELSVKQIFPFDIGAGEKGKYKEDYFVEGDANTILVNLILSYLNYEVNIAHVNSYASENIMRQNSTLESLKKIDERDEMDRITFLKIKLKKEFDKVMEGYIKKKGIGCGGK